MLKVVANGFEPGTSYKNDLHLTTKKVNFNIIVYPSYDKNKRFIKNNFYK